ncbi:hypothetical protein BV25DRAFT_1822288 [Artomyces pyxidatus]|uniref:Uncharacterized protein n=1 Tax=Artomyces pyxidatus TaxID=48021 RepID=A0ACB8T9N5_9AGAM|nr:hypothetical protein BV25DRAFT_1822288 [Artomyces pyxidatus]
MSDPSSSTPPSLTPQSTGTQESTKKTRPQVAFYPNVNATNKPQKPFSRSAAKRESVMALGSIEHLQHYFTKTGIAAKKEFNTQRKGLVPALGGALAHFKGNPSLNSLPEFELPPSPAMPALQNPAFPPYVKTFEVDPENLRPGVIEDLSAVELVWKLPSAESQQNPDFLGVDNHGSAKFDVLNVLKTTTRAIRSVRNYLLSLPDDTSDAQRQQFRPTSLSSAETHKRRQPSQPNDRSNPVAAIRRSALEVLTILRALEESSRIPLSDDAYDVQSDHLSNSGSHSRVASPSGISEDVDQISDNDADTSFAFSVVQVQGRRDSVLVWEEEEDEFKQPSDDEREHRDRWDEKLVLGSGWLYKQDIKPELLAREQEVIGRYLEAVDEILFGGRKGGIRGWERERERMARKEKMERDARTKGRRVSSSGSGLEGESAEGGNTSARAVRRVASTSILDRMQDLTVVEEPEAMDSLEEDDDAVSVEDDELPQWAKRSAFVDEPLSRAHALLVALLPATLLPTLGNSPDRAELLQALSSGQLLCVAYNAGVRRSRKPWGYISKDAIHDIVALEEAASGSDDKDTVPRGWTFRRTDNLRLWAAALRLRYLLSIVTPALPLIPDSRPLAVDGTPLQSPSPSTVKFPTNEPPVYFDARVVARKEDGWEQMLENVLERWVRAVVDERRGDAR